MNAAAAKITSNAVHLQKKENKPFFSKSEDGSFFSKSNKPLQSFFSPASIQPKLTIGQPNDIYEKEADSMADKVVQRLSENKSEVTFKNGNSLQAKPIAPVTGITPFVQAKCAGCEQEEKLQKKEEKDEKDLLKNKLQTKPIFESNAEPPEDDSLSFGEGRGEVLQRKCTECEKEEKLQKKSESNQTTSPNIESSLNSAKGSGSQLPQNTRKQMESSFGVDFSGVRIHNDSSSVQMNKDLHAQAFTHGSDIYFNSDKYDTNSSGGKHLLAHELTHVVQQDMIKKQSEKSDSSIQRKPGEGKDDTHPSKSSQIKMTLSMPVPKDDPIPDYSLGIKKLDAWELAQFKIVPRLFALVSTIKKSGTDFSFVDSINWEFTQSDFFYFIASEILKGAKGTLDVDEIPGVTDPLDKETKVMFMQIHQRIKIHAKEHFVRYRKVIADQTTDLPAKFSKLPDQKAPSRLDEADLKTYVDSYLNYLFEKLNYALWKTTCDWEKADYPNLLKGIKNISASFSTDCDKHKPSVSQQPQMPIVVSPGKQKIEQSKSQPAPKDKIQKKSILYTQ